MTEKSKVDQAMIFDPLRGDPLLSLLRRMLHEKPPLIALFYLAISLGGVCLLAWIGGVFSPVEGMKKSQFLSLKQDIGNLINFGVIVPLGIFLVFRFYRSLRKGINKLMEDGIISFTNDEERDAFLWTLDHKINRSWYFWLALGLAVVLNVWISFNLKHAWNSFYATPSPTGSLSSLTAAVWFRIFATINFTLVFFVLIRGVAVLRLMRLLFEQELKLQPLHPDRCSGLLPLGRISGSLNLFLALITLYLTILIVVDGIPLTNPMFLSVVIVFFLFACFLFLTPLLYSNRQMKQQKDRVLRVLNDEFQTHFLTLAQCADDGSPLPIESIKRMELLEKLNQTAQNMPIWPINMQTISRFFAVAGGPIIVGVLKATLATQPGAGAAKKKKLPQMIQRLLPKRAAPRKAVPRKAAPRKAKAVPRRAKARQPAAARRANVPAPKKSSAPPQP